MKLHHVGITVVNSIRAVHVLDILGKLFGGFNGNMLLEGALQEEVIKHDIPELDCTCMVVGMVEFIRIGEFSPLLKYHCDYQDWTGIKSPIVLHHIAFQVESYDQTVQIAETFGKVVNKGLIGYTGKRVAFIHPSVFGILIEIVEA